MPYPQIRSLLRFSTRGPWLLLIAIFFCFQAMPCQAQEIGDGLITDNVVYCDADSMELVSEGFVENYDTYIEQGNYQARSPWFVRLGVATFLFGESATIAANEFVIPGASTRIGSETTFGFDIGYQLSPKWSATLSAGVPPKLNLDGTGPFEGLRYGTTRYAPIVFALQRHFLLNDRTSVYVGGGVNYTFHYETIDDFVQDLEVDDNVAAVVQLGVERRLNDRVSIFADAKKAFYETDAFGSVGGAPIRGDIKANPTILFFGLRYNL